MTDNLRPNSYKRDLRATLADAGRVDPEVERLRAELTEARAQVAAAMSHVIEFCEAATPSPEWGDDTKSTYRFAGQDIARSLRKWQLDWDSLTEREKAAEWRGFDLGLARAAQIARVFATKRRRELLASKLTVSRDPSASGQERCDAEQILDAIRAEKEGE